MSGDSRRKRSAVRHEQGRGVGTAKAKEILAERDEQAQQLNQFLVELGYE